MTEPYYKNFPVAFSIRMMTILQDYYGPAKNVLVSPSRIEAVLALIATWATDKIEKQILLQLGDPENDLPSSLDIYSNDCYMLDTEDYEVNEEIAMPTIEQQTALWIQEGLKYRDFAVKQVKEAMNLCVKEVDFKSKKTKSVIDEYIRETTHDLIKVLDAPLKPDGSTGFSVS